MTEMDLSVDEAYSFFLQMSTKTFGEVFTNELFERFSSKSKGQSGDMMECLLGKDSDSAALDFYDGELKSYDANSLAVPRDAIKIKMIAEQVDWMLNLNGTVQEYYWGTPIADKLAQLLFLPIDKESSNMNDWRILCPFLVSQYDSEWDWLYDKFAQDVYDICMTIQDDFYNGNYRCKDSSKHGQHIFSSTSSAMSDGRYLFLKTAGDSKPTYASDGILVSDRTYALYMTKLCVKDIIDSMYYEPYYSVIDEYESGDELYY